VGGSPYAVLGLRGIRWPAVGEGREWDELIGGDSGQGGNE
jgi:hypothetical protein